MKKEKKIWLIVALAMFMLPEIFFSFITTFIPGIQNLTHGKIFYEFFLKPQLIVDHPAILFISLIVEIAGVVGLIIWNIKNNFSKSRAPIIFITCMLLISLLGVFFVGYSILNMNFP